MQIPTKFTIIHLFKFTNNLISLFIIPYVNISQSNLKHEFCFISRANAMWLNLKKYFNNLTKITKTYLFCVDGRSYFCQNRLFLKVRHCFGKEMTRSDIFELWDHKIYIYFVQPEIKWIVSMPCLCVCKYLIIQQSRIFEVTRLQICQISCRIFAKF